MRLMAPIAGWGVPSSIEGSDMGDKGGGSRESGTSSTSSSSILEESSSNASG